MSSAFPSSKCDINCEYNIESLDNDVSYTIGVKAYNDNGMAPMSNLVKFIPKYKSGETIYNITNPFNHSILLSGSCFPLIFMCIVY